MSSETKREAMVAFAKYMNLNSFGNFLMNSKSTFATNLDNFLTSFHVNSYYNQGKDKIIDFVPSLFYTPVKERKDYILLASDGGSCVENCTFDNNPSKKPSVKSIQILNMEPYESDVLQEEILKAIRSNEKKRNSATESGTCTK